jgi:hypothetical protein
MKFWLRSLLWECSLVRNRLPPRTRFGCRDQPNRASPSRPAALRHRPRRVGSDRVAQEVEANRLINLTWLEGSPRASKTRGFCWPT